MALLFAGSSTTTIRSPIAEVLTKLSNTLGGSFSFAGGGGAAAPTLKGSQTGERQPFIPGLGGLMPQLPQQAVDRASAVLEVHRANLMFQPGVMGAGVGASGRADGEAANCYLCEQRFGRKTDSA